MRTQLLEDVARANSQSTTPIAQIDPVPRVSIQAFCESPEAAAVIQAAIGDRRMNKAHVKQNMGGAPAAVEAYRNAPTPNVIVIEATGRPRPPGRPARRARPNICDAGTKVIIIGKVNDIVLYRQLIARGVSEYLVLPFSVVDFVSAVSHLFTRAGRQAARPRRSPSIGAKGGVGASTDRPQHRLALRHRPRHGHHHRRSRPRLRHRRARLQPGPAAGHRRGGVRARPRRRHAASTGCCRNAATTCTCSPRRRCSTSSTTSARRASIR